MRTIRQKLQFALVLMLGLSLYVLPGTVQKVSADAAPGTCVIDSIQGADTGEPGVRAQTVVMCKAEAPSGRDANGVSFDSTKCYEVYEQRASVFISEELKCSNSRLTGTPKALCTNGADAPDNIAANCTETTGVVEVGSAVTDPALNGNCKNIGQCDLIKNYIDPFINFLAALVGVVVVISIILGGIQYSTSAGDPQKAGAARARIRNAIIALIVFIFLYALLNFLIPGGLV